MKGISTENKRLVSSTKKEYTTYLIDHDDLEEGQSLLKGGYVQGEGLSRCSGLYAQNNKKNKTKKQLIKLVHSLESI